MANAGPSEEKFLRVFLQNEDDLRSYARALLPTWEAVGEVMQEASVVMWRKLDQLQDESEFLPWAKVIVRYESLRARQKAARDRLCFGDDVFELLAEDEFNPGEDEMVMEREALGQCLARLDPPQKTLVLLPYHGHGAISELAAETGQTVNSLYKKIGRLRSKLTRCVETRLAESALKEGLT